MARFIAKNKSAILIIILLILVLKYFILVQLNTTNLETVINSPLLSPIITLVVGFVAYIIYLKQRDDSKKDAANVILIEIQNAERILKQSKHSLTKLSIPNLDEPTMQVESWSKYKYLFIRDFDRDEWDAITDFYNKCQVYDDAVKASNSSFQKNEEQYRVNIQKVSSDFVLKFGPKLLSENDQQKRELIKKDLSERIIRFRDLYLEVAQLYSPNKPVIDASRLVNELTNNLSQTTIGIKLKALADLRD